MGVSVVSTLLSGGEAAYNGCKLVDHLGDRAEVGMANDAVEQVCFEFFLCTILVTATTVVVANIEVLVQLKTIIYIC